MISLGHPNVLAIMPNTNFNVIFVIWQVSIQHRISRQPPLMLPPRDQHCLVRLPVLWDWSWLWAYWPVPCTFVHASKYARTPCSKYWKSWKLEKIPKTQPLIFITNSNSFTTAGYGSHQNVFIRLDPVGRPPSANSGSYATIASLNKYPTESKKSCNIFDSKYE